MMRAVVRCLDCDLDTGVIEAERTDIGYVLVPSLLSTHAAMPHCPHRLAFLFRDDAATAAAQFECLEVGCKAQRAATYAVAPPFVGAAAIAFHASHEGHRFRMTYGAIVLESPEKPPP